MKDLSIIIPAYKEDRNLEILLPKLKEALSTSGLSSEILVVDTLRPIDNTLQVCQKHAARYINRTSGNNYGDAVRTGIVTAQGERILFMDADGSHSPDFILELLKFNKDYDIVIASRYVENGGSRNNFLLIAMSRILNLTYSLFLNIPCKDISNSFKLYSSTQLKNLKLYCNNFDIVEEIIFKICRNNKNVKIKEVPYFFKTRLFGKTKRNLCLFIISYLLTIFKLRFRK